MSSTHIHGITAGPSGPDSATLATHHGIFAIDLAAQTAHAMGTRRDDFSLSLIDVASRAEIARIPVGKAPVQVGFLPDGSRAFVSLLDEDAVAVIDLIKRQVTARIPVGRGPIQLHASADGRYVFVADQGSAEQPDNRLSVIELAKAATVATIETGTAAHGVDISDDGMSVFVTNVADATVSEIDIATLKVAATYRVGDGPNGIAYLRP